MNEEVWGTGLLIGDQFIVADGGTRRILQAMQDTDVHAQEIHEDSIRSTPGFVLI